MKSISIGDGVGIRVLYDEGFADKPKGNIIGIYYTPPYGGKQWYAANGDWGDCDTEDQARKEIKLAWERG